MNIMLLMPTQFDGKNPQLNEWASEVRAYLTIHNVHFEDYINKNTKSIETVNIPDMQDESIARDVIKLNIKFPQRPDRDDNDANDEYNDLQVTIKKKRDDIMSFSQTLNYA
eukprot:3285835-Amphidinium_carterae.1